MDENLVLMLADKFMAGGDGGTRTRDFLLAKQVLYQLSYVPSVTERTAYRTLPGSHRTAPGNVQR
jgi:hypothetical protein